MLDCSEALRGSSFRSAPKSRPDLSLVSSAACSQQNQVPSASFWALPDSETWGELCAPWLGEAHATKKEKVFFLSDYFALHRPTEVRST